MNSCPRGIRLFRRRRSQSLPLSAPRADTTADTVLNLADPAADILTSIWNEEWQKNIVDVALERVRRQSNPEHYQIFRLHAVKGMGVSDVAKLTGASLPKARERAVERTGSGPGFILR